MKYYYIYKIICLCDEWNGKFYIGKHYGKLDDNYTGSGKLINDYFRKYGKVLDKTYVKEIIDYGDENNICDLEIEYIREGMESELCLNLVRGSSGGNLLGHYHSDETKRKMSEAAKGRVPWNKGKTGCYSEEYKRKIGESQKRRWHTKKKSIIYFHCSKI